MDIYSRTGVLGSVQYIVYCLHTNIYKINLHTPIRNKKYFKNVLTHHGLEIEKKLKSKTVMIEETILKLFV